MDITNKFSAEQLKAYQELVKPESNWPVELRDRFMMRCLEGDSYNRNLDREVIGEYVSEKYA